MNLWKSRIAIDLAVNAAMLNPWTTYDAETLGVPPPTDVPATIQEWAWSSPIWYTPK